MTCVLSPTPISSATALPSMIWSSMTSTADVPIHSTLGLPSQQSGSYGDSPTDSITYRKSSAGHNKKRASRAGTRSVSSLSAAQLERKRANDREAQRAIRQRTKDHIDGLEKQLNDVKQTLETREKLLTAAHQRNRELEDEIAVLRMRMSDASSSAKFSRPTGSNVTSVQTSVATEAPAPVPQRSGSLSHPVSFPLNNTAWQQSGFGAADNLILATNAETQSRNMTGWRARDSPQSMAATPSTSLQELQPPPQTSPYTSGGAEDRSWSNQYEFGQSTQHFSQQPTPTQQPADNNHFNQTQSTAYPVTTQQAQTAFHPPLLLPPQNDFHSFYGFTPQAQSFTGQSQYQQTPNQVQSATNTYSAAQPSPVSATQYHSGGIDQAYIQHIHPPMQFQNDAEFRGYTMAQFPSG